MHLDKNLLQLSGDASFRKFYRIKNKKRAILVFSEKEKKNNLLIYDAINKVLIKNKIKAPKLKYQNYKKNYIEIEDLGDKSVFDILTKSKKKYILYFKIISILSKLQKIKNKKILTFKKKNYLIPKYTKKMLYEESKLFIDWYIPTVVKKKNKIINSKIKKIIKTLINNLKIKKKVFVHRDFHVSNMMIYKNNIFLIDSQDAVYGNVAYDLASLIDDVRIKTTLKDKEKIFSKFIEINKKINIEKFKNDFEILSVLRNLKIIGIFSRLSIRDEKNKYLKFIPYAWKLIEHRTKNNSNFYNLNLVLNKYFSHKIRAKYEN
tara:strand:+ start:15780 stop:16736 length:957 start_codon:yes stop_codon:yes gene_type:complete